MPESQICKQTEAVSSKSQVLVDMSMAGLEGGMPRVYGDVVPTLGARDYKEPRMVAEWNKLDV